MRRTEALQGVRMIKFRSVFERYEANELSQIDAAALLGVTERTFRRWCVRFEDGGEAGLLDRRLGSKAKEGSARRSPRKQSHRKGDSASREAVHFVSQWPYGLNLRDLRAEPCFLLVHPIALAGRPSVAWLVA